MNLDCFGSDLAKECLTGDGGSIPGIRQHERKSGEFAVHQIRICDSDAATRIGKPIGNYLTVDCGRPDRMDADTRERLSRVLAGELRGLTETTCKKPPNQDLSVLIVGLGNASLTADAIGPLTVRSLTATAHLKTADPDLFRALDCSAVSLIAPGVLGQSGIEAGTVVQAISKEIVPDIVIAIDALVARDLERLAATVQISDVGIVPGSGVGNHRAGLTASELGVPVLAMGVPTVVGSSALVYDALAKAGIEDPSANLRKVLENGGDFFVSLKESDYITEQVCSILSRALSLAFLGGMEL